MLLGDDGGSLAAEVDDNPTAISLLFRAMFRKGSTTMRAWKPVIFSLMLVIGELLDTVHTRKMPALVSEVQNKNNQLSWFISAKGKK